MLSLYVLRALGDIVVGMTWIETLSFVKVVLLQQCYSVYSVMLYSTIPYCLMSYAVSRVHCPFTKDQKASKRIMLASTSIQGFYLGEELGRGAQATVRLGFNPDTGKQVAIKLLSKTNTEIMQAKKEFKIHASIDHQNIIKVFSCTEDLDTIYIMMEYAASGELFDKIEPDIGLEEAITRQVA